MSELSSDLEVHLKVPDLWQQDAIRALQAGKDVVVDAPTGAGKTYIFEQWLENSLRGQAIYTVPTRALANDKLIEWRAKGWNVGIATGDLAENLNAPVVVATLEAQKSRLLAGEGPALLVIDEYQMLGDMSRGTNYELAIALAPEDTQLLLLSGSVGNPESVVAWLRRLGREVDLIQHLERPVPLDEIHIEALPEKGIPARVRGLWPRAVARVLKAGMAPLLAFAPRRKAAERLAIDIARQLPEEDPLILTPEQQQLAGDELARLLKARVAYHHSGLSYRQRAGLVEPLAKAGQLRVVVATMGLSAGINFSMRSVLVTDREYRAGDRTHQVRPDELLQMFGRAGRRGIDKRGFALVVPGGPRLNEGRPLHLKRHNTVDWPSFLSVMHLADVAEENPVLAAHSVASRLFSAERVPLGLREFAKNGARTHPDEEQPPTRVHRQQIVEIQTPDGEWERQRAPQKGHLKDVVFFHQGKWKPALSVPATLEQIPVGNLCRMRQNGKTFYGRELPLARLGRGANEGELVLTHWLWKQLKQSLPQPRKQGPRISREHWTLEQLEREVLPQLPMWTMGGRALEIETRGDTLVARLDYREAFAYAYRDGAGRYLLAPPERTTELVADLRISGETDRGSPIAGPTPADAWFQLGLIDRDARPTRRGVLFSFFNHGEGLAIAAALEDATYPIEELIFDVANLRAGHRFQIHEEYSGRLGGVCRSTYRNATYHGYLRKGVPPEYGDGAAETLRRLDAQPGAKQKLMSDELLSGDIERARLEWRSLLNHIAHAPELEWERWLELRAHAGWLVSSMPEGGFHPEDLPPLTSVQRKRHKSFLRFD
ncbi:MAG: DEAD/DEAH box helicase [Verrucomicrobiota bacterium JB022]|nr:DEAD/DEAH box helicase [Verrucomicrobiota bacterium JB022]